MSEEKLIEYYKLAKSQGDDQKAIKSLERLKEIRSGKEYDPVLPRVPNELRMVDQVEAQPEPQNLGFFESLVSPDAYKRAMDLSVGALDVAGTTAASAIPATAGTVLGFFESVAEEIASGEYGSPEAAQRIKQKALERAGDFTIQPFTEAGREIQQGIGEFATGSEAGRALTVASMGAAPFAGQTSVAPAIARMRELAKRQMIDPKSGLPVGPLKKSLDRLGAGADVVDTTEDLPRLIDQYGPDKAVDLVTKKKIQQGSDNQYLAKLMLEDDIKGPKIVKDKLGEKAINQGFRAGDVAMSKNANKPTRKAFLNMLKDKRKEINETGSSERPLVRAGEVVAERINVLRDRASILRKKLNSIANGERFEPGTLGGPGVTQGLKGLKIDTSSLEKAVFDGLDRLDIDIPDNVRNNPTLLNDFIKDKGAFVASAISEDGGSKSLIKKTIKLLNEARDADAYEAHKIKRQIDSMLDWESTKYKGIKGEGENFAKNIRRELNQSVREVSEPYAAVNDELSQIAGALNSFRNAVGNKKIDWFGDDLAINIGTQLRKLETNYGNAQALAKSASEIDSQVRKLGVNTDIDTGKLVKFAYLLDERFRPSKRGSFTGSMAGVTSGETAAMDAIAGSKTAAALGMVRKGVEALRKTSDDEAMNTMQQLLTR